MSHTEQGCCCHHTTSVHQTLDEMEFERGLWSAAYDGDLQRIQELLKSGKDPCQLDSSGYTALHYASRNGHYDACKELLQRGACVNATTRSGNVTPLHRAAFCGQEEVVKLLLQFKADVNILDSDGMLPLHKACEKDQLGIAKHLVSSAPKTVHVQDRRGKTPLDYIKTKDSTWDEILNGV